MSPTCTVGPAAQAAGTARARRAGNRRNIENGRCGSGCQHTGSRFFVAKCIIAMVLAALHPHLQGGPVGGRGCAQPDQMQLSA
ncbi:Uncharacterised protein [Bordetella pertussis]|nr:Uncharacterised protein [Bordetella pertussis]